MIHKIAPSGAVTRLAGLAGVINSDLGKNQTKASVEDIAVDGDGNLYVTTTSKTVCKGTPD